MKKILELIFVFTLIMSTLTSVSAKGPEKDKVNYMYDSLERDVCGIEELGNYSIGVAEMGDYEIDAIDACNGHDTHDMVASGIGFVYKGVYPDSSMCMIYGGYTWQCSRCNDVVITEWDPLETNYVGNYAFWSPGYKITNITYLWTNSIYFTSSGKVPYCKLRYLT